MKVKPSNRDISVLTSHIIAALNDVTVCRYAYNKGQRSKDPIKRIRVPLTIGHKTRQLAETIQVNGQIRLPVISITMTGFSLDPSRNTSKKMSMIDGRWDGTDGYMQHRKPTPVNINYNVSIMTTKGSDLEEILLHYMSVFNPSIQVSWMNPLVPERLISKITWDGSATPNFPIDTGSEEKIRYQTDMGFTLEGWVFPENQDNLESVKCIDFNVGLLDGVEYCGDVIDNITLDSSFKESIKPEVRSVEPYCIEAGKFVTVYGKNLSEIEGIYLQNTLSSDIPVSSYNPFCFSESLSAECPEFEGYALDYTILDFNTLSVKIPEGLEGELDLIVTNRHGGCSKLSDSEFCKNKGLEVKT